MTQHCHSPQDLERFGQDEEPAPQEFQAFATFDGSISREGGGAGAAVTHGTMAFRIVGEA